MSITIHDDICATVKRIQTYTVDHTECNGHQRQKTVYVSSGWTGPERDQESSDAKAPGEERPDAAQPGTSAAKVPRLSAATAAGAEAEQPRAKVAARMQRALRLGKGVSATAGSTSATVEQGPHSLDAKTRADSTHPRAMDPKQKRIR